MNETKALIILSQNGDKNAKEQLVANNLGLVWSVVKRFTNRGFENDDLFQIGSIGLIKSIDKFDLSFDVQFSTYAVPMIIGEIKRFIRDDGLIKVSRSLKEMSTKAKYMQAELLQKNGKTPTIDELASALDVETCEVVLAMEACRDVESLHKTVNTSDSKTIFLIDKIEHSQDTSEKMIDNLALKQIIDNLEPRERQIIMLRFFKDKTQQQVADKIGVSQVQVSRIEKKVLQKMKNEFY